MSELRKLIEAASVGAERIFRKDGEITRPIWHAYRADGTFFVQEATAPNKQTQWALIRVLFEIEHVVRYVQVMEAWTLRHDVSREEADLMMATPKRSIRNHPDRQEVVYFSAEDQHEGSMIAERLIVRGKGKPSLGPLDFLPYIEGAGRVVALLPTSSLTRN